jgi:transposase
MIALESGIRVHLASGTTDMRKSMAGLAMLVQQGLAADPFDGAVFAFRGRRAGLIKLLWHDGVGLCMLTKRLEHGQFVCRPRHRRAGLRSLRRSWRLCWTDASGERRLWYAGRDWPGKVAYSAHKGCQRPDDVVHWVNSTGRRRA